MSVIQEKKIKKERGKKKDKSAYFRYNKDLYLEALLSVILIFSLTYLAWIHNLADISSKVSTVSEIISLFCMAKLFTLVMLKWITLRESDFSWQLIEIRDTTLVIALQMSSLFAFSSDSQLLATDRSLLIVLYQWNSLDYIPDEMKRTHLLLCLLVALLYCELLLKIRIPLRLHLTWDKAIRF